MTDLQIKMKMIHHKDNLLKQIKESWGVGSERSDQAKRLVDGNIDLDKDIGAIQALATIVNLQLALDDMELQELEGARS